MRKKKKYKKRPICHICHGKDYQEQKTETDQKDRRGLFVLGDPGLARELRTAFGNNYMPPELINLIMEYDFGTKVRVDGETRGGKLVLPTWTDRNLDEEHKWWIELIGRAAAEYQNYQWQQAQRGYSIVTMRINEPQDTTEWVWMLGFSRDAAIQFVDTYHRKWFLNCSAEYTFFLSTSKGWRGFTFDQIDRERERQIEAKRKS